MRIRSSQNKSRLAESTFCFGGAFALAIFNVYAAIIRMQLIIKASASFSVSAIAQADFVFMSCIFLFSGLLFTILCEFRSRIRKVVMFLLIASVAVQMIMRYFETGFGERPLPEVARLYPGYITFVLMPMLLSLLSVSKCESTPFFSRKVVGWSMNYTLDRKLTIAALDMAIEAVNMQAVTTRIVYPKLELSVV